MTAVCATGEHDQHDVYAELCPCRGLLDLIANKWTTLAVGALEHGPLRFGAVQRRLEGVSPKVLTATLRRLEEAGLVTRTVFPAVPLHVEYSLTPVGESLIVPLRGLREWAEKHLHQIASLTDISR